MLSSPLFEACCWAWCLEKLCCVLRDFLIILLILIFISCFRNNIFRKTRRFFCFFFTCPESLLVVYCFGSDFRRQTFVFRSASFSLSRYKERERKKERRITLMMILMSFSSFLFYLHDISIVCASDMMMMTTMTM